MRRAVAGDAKFRRMDTSSTFDNRVLFERETRSSIANDCKSMPALGAKSSAAKAGGSSADAFQSV